MSLKTPAQLMFISIDLKSDKQQFNSNNYYFNSEIVFVILWKITNLCTVPQNVEYGEMSHSSSPD